MSGVAIADLGHLPQYFKFLFDQADFITADGANGHHEGRTSVQCEQPFWRKDVLTLAGWRTKQDGYHFEIKFDASVRLDLFRRGRVEFDFDPQAKRWNMKAYVPGETRRREWLFCDPEDALQRILSALECFRLQEPDPEFVKAITLISDSLKNQASAIAGQTPRYEEAVDCDGQPTSAYETCSWCPQPGIPD